MMIISTIQKFSLFLLSFCSLSITHKIAFFLSKIFFTKNSKKYHVTYKNLRACFPNKSKAWYLKKTKESLAEYAKSMLETPYVYRKSQKNFNRLINKVYSENLINDALGEKKGVIFMTPHHGSWETSGLYAASKIKTFTMYKPCLLYTSPSPRDVEESRMPSSA